MQCISAAMVCLSHGSNDVSNAIAPLLILMKINSVDSIYSFILGGVGIALGLIIYGEKVMKTIGKKIIVLDYFKGFATEISTATTICISSIFGIPISTHYCLVGALVGVWFGLKSKRIQQIYKEIVDLAEILLP